MADTIDVYLISGFLGAGKTTLLNRLIAEVPEDITFLVLMNEFGDVGLDGTLIEGEDLDMLEISKGSIFCACVKTDFIKALNEIAGTVTPDVMLIETTGVANPHDLDRDLKLPLFGDVFQLRDKFCVIDAANFLDTYESFIAIEKQLASSDVFIINKVDLAEEETLAEIRQVVLEFNPEARFLEAEYADVPFSELFTAGSLKETMAGGGSAEEVSGGAAPADEPTATEGEPSVERLVLSEAELETYIEDLLSDETAEVTPPDVLESAVLEMPAVSSEELEERLSELPDGLVRAKGIVEVDGELCLFSLVNGRWTINAYEGREPAEEVRGRIVFISHPKHIRVLKEGQWTFLDSV